MTTFEAWWKQHGAIDRNGKVKAMCLRTWHAAQQSAAEAQRAADLALFEGTECNYHGMPQFIRKQPLITEKPE